ncbi:MAG: MATE family efflux transporter [Oscillospiraceae bacterium]|nr:MATE family efflux transporter [Oscillospiraceae bacterium]
MFTKFRNTFIGDKAFYRRILYLAVPMIIQNAVTSFVSFLDNIMVGQIGTEQMSGVAIVNQLMFVFNICIFGGVSGAGIFGTQFFGKGDYEGQKYAFRFKMYAVLAISVIAFVLFGFFDKQLISLYLSDTGSVGDITLALKYGQEYLLVMLTSLVPFAVCQAYVSTIRETGQTLVPMIASAAAVGVNLILDYIFIFGLGEIPAMGVKGAAIATVAARIIECVIVLVWTHTHKDKNPYIKGAYRGFGIPVNICRDIFKKGTPLMLNEMLWAAGMAVIAQCYAVRGLEVVAAQNISSTITNLFNIVYIQLGASISVIVGQSLGAGRLQEAKVYANRMIFFSVGCCTVFAGIMALIGGFFPSIYNTEESIRELASIFIFISALAMPLCAFSHCAYFTLRSGGKTGITFLFDSVYTWVLLIPFAFVLANFTALPIITVFFLVQFTEAVKVVIGFFMIKSGVWLQNIVTKELESA